ncbi:MAG: 4'-phosphopantetheinyl transferase superfamily protein [Bacteroidia bacterium]
MEVSSISNNWLHIWQFDFNPSMCDVDATILSNEEKLRSRKFIHQLDKDRYQSAHYFLRKVLSRYLTISPEKIAFKKNSSGKPYLKKEQTKNLYFNISYRNRYVLIGISNISNIGVDIEEHRNIDDLPSFCKNFFSEDETHSIFISQNNAMQRSVAFSFWAMKEAFIKASGIGFSQDLTNHNLNEFLSTTDSCFVNGHIGSWIIQLVEVDKNYKAAFAANAPQINLHFYNSTQLNEL